VAVVLEVGLAAYVQPNGSVAVGFEEQLVEVQVVVNPEVPCFTGLLVGQVQVGGASVLVHGVSHAVHELVQFWTAVSACDADGLAEVVAQWLQYFLAEVLHVADVFACGQVDDAVLDGCLAAEELTECEVFRQLHVGVGDIVVVVHCCYVFVCFYFCCFRLSCHR